MGAITDKGNSKSEWTRITRIPTTKFVLKINKTMPMQDYVTKKNDNNITHVRYKLTITKIPTKMALQYAVLNLEW